MNRIVVVIDCITEAFHNSPRAEAARILDELSLWLQGAEVEDVPWRGLGNKELRDYNEDAVGVYVETVWGVEDLEETE